MKRKGYNSNKQAQQLKKSVAKKLKKSFLVIILLFVATVAVYSIIKLTLFSFSVVWDKVSNSESFRLTEIYVSGNSALSEEEIITLSAVEYGKSLLAIDNKAVENRLLTETRIERAIVTKEFPSKLKIRVTERQPLALVNIDKIYEIDKNGVLMDLIPRAVKLPMITGFETDSIGFKKFNHQIADNLKTVINFISALKIRDSSVVKDISEFKLDKGNSITIVLNNGITQVYMGSSDFCDKSAHLIALMRKKGDNIMKHDYIDLRFNNLAFVR